MVKSIRILILISLCISSLFGYGQEDEESDTSKTKKIDLIHADSLEYNSASSKAQMLKGNVAFRYKETDMFCDSAFMFKDSNVIKAYDNIHIKNNEGVEITGDSLTYYGNDKLARITGNVKLIEKDKTLDAPIVEYNMDSKLAYYFGGGILVDKSENSTLTSQVGYYYTDIKKFFFKDSVVYKHPDYVINTDTMMHHTESDITYFLGPTKIDYEKDTEIICKYGWFNQKTKDCQLVDSAKIIKDNQVIIGDSIFYNDSTTKGSAFGNVMLIDTAEKIMIKAEKTFFVQNDSMYLATECALFMEYSGDDTLYLHGDTLYSIYDSISDGKIIQAFPRVKFFNKDMQGMCDSLSMTETDSMIHMYRTPILWTDSNELKADSIKIKYSEGNVDSIFFTQNAFVITTLDSNKYNQIKGDDMIGYFKENKLRLMDVFGNAKTIYYPKDKEEYIGINEATSDDMRMYFNDDGVKKIVFLKPNESTLSPVKEATDNKLAGFKNYYSHKPNSWVEIFDWNLYKNQHKKTVTTLSERPIDAQKQEPSSNKEEELNQENKNPDMKEEEKKSGKNSKKR